MLLSYTDSNFWSPKYITIIMTIYSYYHNSTILFDVVPLRILVLKYKYSVYCAFKHTNIVYIVL